MDKQPLWMKNAREETPQRAITPERHLRRVRGQKEVVRRAAHRPWQQAAKRMAADNALFHVVKVDATRGAVLIVLAIEKGEQNEE